MNSYLKYIQDELMHYLKENNIKNVVIGLSSGIDSTVCLYILKSIINKENIFAYYIPINQKISDDILLIEKETGIKINIIDASDIYNSFINVTNNNFNNFIYDINKSRIRSNLLYMYANYHKGIVISCLNYDEWYLGYFTKYGDSAGDFCLINGLSKKYVYELAKLLNVNPIIINKDPSAELYINQTDEQELGFSYNDLDKYYSNSINNIDIIKKIEDRHKKNLHKQKGLILLKPYLKD